MKSRILLSIAIVVILVATALIIRIQLKKNALNRPESIAFDPDSGKFLISNMGNGSIVAMDSTGALETIISKGLSQPRGIKMLLKKLWVADDKQVHSIDLQAKKIVQSIPIPGAKMLNDIEIDELGILYISDTKADCIWILNPINRQIEQVKNELIKQPNGLYYDKPRRQMLIVSMGDKQPILAYNTKTKETSVFMDTIYSELDGIQADEPGRIFFSSWKEKALIMIPQTQNQFHLIRKDLTSPADIYWHEPTNELLVPLMEKNEILRIKLDEE